MSDHEVFLAGDAMEFADALSTLRPEWSWSWWLGIAVRLCAPEDGDYYGNGWYRIGGGTSWIKLPEEMRP